MYEVRSGMPLYARVIIDQPRDGWSRDVFDRQIAQYVADRGAPPRTATLHPDTMTALGFATSWIDAGEDQLSSGPLLISSTDYDRESITLYE